LENTRIASIRDKVFEKWKELGYVNGLAWHDFDGGIELRRRPRQG
jgi:hypothetical protein